MQPNLPPAGIFLPGAPPFVVAPPASPEQLVRAVTGAVLSVTANLRLINAAIAAGDAPDIGRALAALNAAVAEQSRAARGVLAHLSPPD